MPYFEPEAYLENIDESMHELIKQIKESNYLLRLLVSNSYEAICNENLITEENK